MKNVMDMCRTTLRLEYYFFPSWYNLSILICYGNNNDLIWEIINKSIAEEDFLVLRKLLLDITCFSLDTFCYQRRFWEKTYDILTDLILLLYPMSNENMVFADKRQELDRSIIEALAILHYAHPEETDIMLTNLANSYNTAVNKASIDFVAQLNRESKAAIYNKFQVLRSNIIQMDKKDNPIEIKILLSLWMVFSPVGSTLILPVLFRSISSISKYS